MRDVMHFMSLYGAIQKSIAKYWQDYTLSTSLIKLRAKHQFKVYKSLNCHARTVLWCHFPYFKRSLLLLASPFLWETRLPYFQKKSIGGKREGESLFHSILLVLNTLSYPDVLSYRWISMGGQILSPNFRLGY